MEESFARFHSSDATELVKVVVAIGRLAQDRNMRTLAVGAFNLAHDIFIELNALATRMAAQADELIVERIDRTHTPNRPRSQTNEMATHIVSKPGPLGSVQVGMLAELEKIVNPRGWGSFWRAQEFGTGQSGRMLGGEVSVPSQEGRVLFGTYEPSGEPPDSAQRGLGVGHDAAFLPMGSAPGQGVISVELPARHFLTDGSIEAGGRYLAAVAKLQEGWVARLRELRRLLVAEQRTVRVFKLDA